MTSSAVAQSSPPPKPSTPDFDGDDDEEIEYEEIEEEIEVEEEVEIEEEVDEEAIEEEVDADDDFEIGEDLTPVREEKQENDSKAKIEHVDHEECIPGSLTPGVSVSELLPDIATIHNYFSDEGERTSRDYDAKNSDAIGDVNDIKGELFGGDVCAASTMADESRKGNNADVSLVAEPSHTAVDAVQHRKPMSPRLHVPQIRLRDSSFDAELDPDSKRLRIACEFHAKGWCIKGNSCRFLHIKKGLDIAAKKEKVFDLEASSSAHNPSQQSGESPVLHGVLNVCKSDGLGGPSPPADRGSLVQTSYLDNYRHYTTPQVKGSLIDGNTIYDANVTGFSVISRGSHRNARISTYEIPGEEIISKRNDIMLDECRSADLYYSHSKQPVSFGSYSWRTDAFGTRNLLKNNVENRASVSSSLQRSTSLFSGSETESLLRKHTLSGTELANYKVKIFSDDWEPSVPFCPSHAITRNLLLKERLYDPIRDSVEKTDAMDGKVIFSHSDQGSSIKNVRLQSKKSEEVEKILNPNYVVKQLKGSTSSSSYDNQLKLDKSSHKTELKVDGSVNENAVDSKREMHVQNESKALKYFQAALIDFVKELVKPTWREGLMSKDAHKVIVKKSVDKVLSTLPVQQIPSTHESIKLYLSASQPKLAKLVEGYIDKYGKY